MAVNPKLEAVCTAATKRPARGQVQKSGPGSHRSRLGLRSPGRSVAETRPARGPTDLPGSRWLVTVAVLSRERCTLSLGSGWPQCCPAASGHYGL